MLKLDILGILITLLLLDVFNYKRILLASLSIDILTLSIILYLGYSYDFYKFGGIFSYVSFPNLQLEVLNFFPFIIGIFLSKYFSFKSGTKGNLSINYLIPWNFSPKWQVVFYKLAFYNLFFQLTRWILRG
ncbi:hypothetical protein [Anaerobranca gottschalkii]|uniref:Uncharacterized protein n=1 Tax=Anaerobranca gottschalkii DSM 13577 TaxID=1120990 RepID=A0A1H9Y0X5_9FIRM|nr:hypothetical protein [Anaerobranca gottschalkii]SES62338.1 hypothetical protein SAMN03080614_100138 [Anaerobranca gottschalkii DSM 13577]